MTGILDLDSFNPELILMEPEVATVPQESLEIYEQILIGESNPENSAWIEYLDKCIAVG
ncbi:hypothetical protein LC653_29955 [Nostoc sp. CHAB 5784]|uniref:hypothetical protein n=1 Tax=Nostoc mirabile TaxID=2907820 RepID=UPI001E472240|nr:hypothetical protein [Nostoc mirabile]MCC5667984.1 hypothetical protein [Nostoc mirabile CHAB5784]